MKKNKIKIVQISSVHPSNDTRIFYKICKSLVGNGFSVDLIIQHEKNEIKEGVQIYALPIANSKIDRPLKIIPKLLSKCLKYPKGTIIHFHDSELIPIGLYLKLIGYKVIYDVHEDVPKDVLSKDWLPDFLKGVIAYLVGRLESLCKNYLNAIIVVTPEIQKRFKSKKTVLIQNFPLIEQGGVTINDKLDGEKVKQIFYLGDITEIRGIKELVKAMELINEKENVELTLAGRFSPENFEEELKRESGWKYVNFVGWISRSELKDISKKVFAGVVTFLPVPNHIEAQPNKLFEYMYLGLPIIGSKFPLWEEIITQNKCGILVDPESPKEIADAILWLKEHKEEAKKMGLRGQKAVLEKYSWGTEEKKLLKLYDELVTS